MDDPHVTEHPKVPIEPDVLELLNAIAVVRKRTQLEVLKYAVELAQKTLPPTPKVAGSTGRGRRSAAQS